MSKHHHQCYHRTFSHTNCQSCGINLTAVKFSSLPSQLVCKSLDRKVLEAAIPVTTANRLLQPHGRAHTKNLAHGVHTKLSRLKTSTYLPALLSFPLMKKNRFTGNHVRECSTPQWKHSTSKFHTCQMLKREHNSEYMAKLLKEHSVELLQPPLHKSSGRNKRLHWWKTGKEAEWGHVARSVKDIKWEARLV